MASLHPEINGSRETIFDFALQDQGISGQELAGRLVDDPLSGSVAESQVVVEGKSEFHNAVVKIGASVLQAMSHAHAVSHLKQRLKEYSRLDIRDILDH